MNADPKAPENRRGAALGGFPVAFPRLVHRPPGSAPLPCLRPATDSDRPELWPVALKFDGAEMQDNGCTKFRYSMKFNGLLD